MKKIILSSLCSLFIALSPGPLRAQNNPLTPYHLSTLDYYSMKTGLDLRLPEEYSRSPQRSRSENSVRIEKVSKEYFVPFELDKGDLAKIAVASSVAVVFFANDAEITQFTQDHKSQLSTSLAHFGDRAGSDWGVGAALTGIVVGIVMDNDRVKNVSIMAAEAMLISGLATSVVKTTFGRERPRNQDNPYVFNGPGLSQSNSSFPSGHTTAAFALATVIAESTQDESMIIPILAYSTAAIVGWSRVHDRAHWASDVIIGGLIGHLVAKNVVNADLAKKGFMIVPTLGLDGSFSVNVRYTGRVQESSCAEGKTQYQAISACIEEAFKAQDRGRFF